jgi:hyperosmotically inducible protein
MSANRIGTISTRASSARSAKRRNCRRGATQSAPFARAAHGKLLIFLQRETWHAHCGQLQASPAGLAALLQMRKGATMRLDKAAITILGVTALAWSIPFAQSAESPQPGVIQPQANSAEFVRLDANRDGFLSFSEVKQMDEYHKPFAEADANRDGRLDATEAIKAQQLYERALAARYAGDAWITAKVKTALLREKGLDSMDVSVETFDNRVLLSGFVADEEQKKKALLVASTVAGVQGVKDGLATRK